MNIAIYQSFLKLVVTVVFSSLITLNLVAQKYYPDNNTLYERTWLATDRDVYIPGDKILVSLATIDGYYQLPITYSAVAYVELLALNGTPIIQEKAILQKGKGSIQLHLPKNIETDFYFIRAYTNYQKNFGENSFFVKKIRLINPFKFITVDKKDDTVTVKGIAYRYVFKNDSLFITCKDSISSLTVKSAFDNEYLIKNTTRINDSTMVIPLRGMKNVLSVHTDGVEPLLLSDSAQGFSISANISNKNIEYQSNGNQESNTLYVASAFSAEHGRFTDTYCLPSESVVIPNVFTYAPEFTSDKLFGRVSLKPGSSSK